MSSKIMSEAGRRANVTRPLTRSLDYGEEGLAMNATSALQRLVSRAERRDECLIYAGGTTQRSGHALVGYRGQKLGAHRLVWILTRGAIPDGLVVRHDCDVPRCININHLQLGTVGENNEDRMARGRHVALPGELNGFAKLTDDQAREIKNRQRRGERTAELATAFGVSATVIRDIASGRRWTHIESDIPDAERVIGRRSYHGERTACSHGHEYTPENTYWRTRNGRQMRMCRTCGRLSRRSTARIDIEETR